MNRNQFDERNRRFNIPQHELDRMYRVLQEQMMMEQLMMEAARQAGAASSAAGPGGIADTTPTSYIMTFGIEVDVDGNRFRFGIEATSTGSTIMTVDWGDGQTEEFTINPSDSLNFTHTYDLAGNYTVNVTLSDPTAIRGIYGDAND